MNYGKSIQGTTRTRLVHRAILTPTRPIKDDETLEPSRLRGMDYSARLTYPAVVLIKSRLCPKRFDELEVFGRTCSHWKGASPNHCWYFTVTKDRK